MRHFSITASHIGKRFYRGWIFREFSYTFISGKAYAITGPNGSGKSTLLQILWGQLPPSSGELHYTSNNTMIEIQQLYQHISIATPYMDLIEEFTLNEHLSFHFRFKPLQSGISLNDIASDIGIIRNQAIGEFSSGMRQRLRLALAFYADTPVLFLDEPFSNLDAQGISWCRNHIEQAIAKRTLIVASNDPREYDYGAEIIDIRSYKTKTTLKG